MAITDDLTLRGAHLHGDYKLAEMHLHWGSNNTIGSEHSVNGRKRPAEVTYYNTGLRTLKSSLQTFYGSHHDLVHRYKHSTVVITIWFIVTICPYLIREWIFYYLHIYFSFFYHCQDFNRTWMHIWVTQWVSCKYQEQLTFPEHPMLPVSLNCPFIIAHLVFVNVYLINPLDLLNKDLACQFSYYDIYLKKKSLKIPTELFRNRKSKDRQCNDLKKNEKQWSTNHKQDKPH